MYNLACTRCFGWTPSTMMVPMADFMNHLPVDTSFDVFNRDFPNKSVNVDYSSIFTSHFLADLDPEFELKIRGCPIKSGGMLREESISLIRTQIMQSLINGFSFNDKFALWDSGYKSTDVAEDNNSESEQSSGSEHEEADEEYYDEEDEDDEDVD